MQPNNESNAAQIAALQSIAQAILGGGGKLNTYTNTGDGGGVGYYGSLGDFKFCFGTSGSFSVAGAGNKSIGFPAGFFTIAPTVIHDKFGSAVFATQNGNIPTTTQANIYFSTGTGTCQLMWLAIGR